ncbi:MAG: hypothetical protein A2849_03410 [Candidatus Taylorbacteria bacterium RIFCSPHIGHO2_01_FULL_51_15]|uniref:Uncharacterized protein n=1 Tax=Candidatus Taylorbacteria bacterium RIFCSPHIGHO2_01_FULL_51_15 TaxID=1802304 RepID=A0A1G2MA85_9BACT|nr:MAG: hypothetical protein A2849_03410 [Candidatus Taylorbacteria bacterium RIFCSPHIGHO2_01_FULL_51_15]
MEKETQSVRTSSLVLFSLSKGSGRRPRDFEILRPSETRDTSFIRQLAERRNKGHVALNFAPLWLTFPRSNLAG